MFLIQINLNQKQTCEIESETFRVLGENDTDGLNRVVLENIVSDIPIADLMVQLKSAVGVQVTAQSETFSFTGITRTELEINSARKVLSFVASLV